MKNPLTLNSLMALFAADIDIFLIQAKCDKETDVTFSKEEIRDQLTNSISKMNEVLEQHGYNINKPLAPAFLPDLDIQSE